MWWVVHNGGDCGRCCGECGWWCMVVVIVGGECGWWCMVVVIVGGDCGWWYMVVVIMSGDMVSVVGDGGDDCGWWYVVEGSGCDGWWCSC